MAEGVTTVVGFKKHTNDWGSGLPVVVGAGDGIEVDSEGLAADVQHIQNQGLFGSGTQRPGANGPKLHSGPLMCPAYFRGLEVLIALAFGTAVTPAQQGGSAAYSHGYRILGSTAGLYGTLVAAGSDHPGVREWPHAHVGGLQFTAQSGELSKFQFDMVPFDLNLNVGSPSAAFVVASVAIANTTYTIANQPTNPSPLSIAVTGSPTEHVVTIVGTNRDGNQITEVYTYSTDGASFTTANYFDTVTSVTGSGTSGTGNITVGVTNGVNNASTYGSISLPSSADRELCLFQQMAVYINDQGGADFNTAFAEDGGDQYAVDQIQVSLDRSSRKDRITTRFGTRIDQPGSNGFIMATCGINFPDWNAANNPLFIDRLGGGAKKKVKIVLTGPEADSGYALELAFFLNNVQLTAGSPNAGGPGEIRFDLEGKAHQASASPTGLPSWADTNALSCRLVNLRTTSALS